MGKKANEDEEVTKVEVTESKQSISIFGLKTIIGLIALAVIVVGAVLLVKALKKKEPVKEVITVSTLEKIIEVSELSTFTVVYNGVAEVSDYEGKEDVGYYVSYEANVKAGIDFEDIEISVDQEKKVVNIKLPEVEIMDTFVDIGSLDYIFVNDKLNTPTISEEAFKLCKYDVMMESNNQEAIIESARQNAVNVVNALVSPFVKQVDPEFEIVIE
ncbi:MAG: DUF4230 domain-containing protein [Lachnospiraceae bacterium]|nr:DUF4230 domain-containing protein [Lachnospiraceae bacterium]